MLLEVMILESIETIKIQYILLKILLIEKNKQILVFGKRQPLSQLASDHAHTNATVRVTFT